MKLFAAKIYKDIAIYLGSIWKQYDQLEMELYEYEEFFLQETAKSGKWMDGEEKCLQEVLQFYRCFLIDETKETAAELMQLYTDMHQFPKSCFLAKKMYNVIGEAGKTKSCS